MGFSAINVPGEAETFKKVISGDIIYYVRATGSDTNTGLAATGSGDGPFLTVDKAIQTINKFAIAHQLQRSRLISVHAPLLVRVNLEVVVSTNQSPQCDRIVLFKERNQQPFPFQNIRTYGPNSGNTGGYFMEVRLESLPTSGSNPGITAGDIFVIEEPNYL